MDGSDRLTPFENDVKIYGIQTRYPETYTNSTFENDVKIYGIQTGIELSKSIQQFENDVKIYGIQTMNDYLDVNTGV